MPARPCRVDSHQHFWRLSRGDYGWLDAGNPALRPLVRDVEPPELLPLLQQHGIAQTVLVQAAPTEAETAHLLQLAAAHPFIAGVVGWLDLSQPRSADTLARWARAGQLRHLKSLRPMLQDLPEPDWIAQAPHPAVVQALLDHGLRLDALVQPVHLPALRRFIERWPTLPVVIDHAAKPALAQGWQAPWAAGWQADMAALARAPRLACKFSGLLTEAGPCASTAQALAAVQPVWEAMLTHFGPERLMWGSDWPVLTLAAGYDRWVAVCRQLAERLPPAAQAAFWGGTATQFYGLAPLSPPDGPATR